MTGKVAQLLIFVLFFLALAGISLIGLVLITAGPVWQGFLVFVALALALQGLLYGVGG